MIRIAAVRGRSEGDWYGSKHYQSLEIRTDDLSNSLTHVAKDNYVYEDTEYDRRRMLPDADGTLP